MGAVDTPEAKGGKKKKGGLRKRAPKRLGIKIDMTPFVDIAFLLLIFFMCTTVFRKPQALEINLPPDPKAKVEIAESNVMTVRIINPAPPSDEIRIFWRVGKEPFVEEKWQDMRGIFAQQSKANAKIVALLKIDRTAKYKYMVDIIDQLQFAELNRFSLAPLDEKEKAEQLTAIQ
jgi:biopolymer transport protein ExbD